MNRRSFFRSIVAIPSVIAAATAGAYAGTRRMSAEEGDPGHVAFLMAVNAGKKVEVYCDGAKVPFAITADEAEGMVLAYTPHPDTGEIFRRPGESTGARETLRGHVEIRVIPPAARV